MADLTGWCGRRAASGGRGGLSTRGGSAVTFGVVVVAAVILLALAPLAHVSREAADADQDGARPLGADAIVTVGLHALSGPLRSDFTGISLEYPALTGYAPIGAPAARHLLAALLLGPTGGRPPLLRIGGDSTDTTGWPHVAGLPPARNFMTLSPAWLSGLRALVVATHAHVILGINLEANHSAIAIAEATGLARVLPAGTITALEVGNEPLRYGRIPWYRNAHHRLVYARPRGYRYQRFAREFATVATRLPVRTPLAGPTLGGSGWMNHLDAFLAAEPRVRLVTYHSYPLNRCFTRVNAPDYATIAHLLDRRASQGLASRLARYVAVAHRRGLRFRVDELNSVACGGRDGVSDTYASALWVLDALFAMAASGVDGVNVHTFPRADYGLFTLRRAPAGWRVTVSPEYLGMLAFARAAPAGSVILAVHAHGPAPLRTWATRGPDGTDRVTLINPTPHTLATVVLRVVGGARSARIAVLSGPSLAARWGARVAGAGVDASTGRLGPLGTECLRSAAPGVFRLEVAPASAAIVETPPRGACTAGSRDVT